jgi:hypothetical protein
LAFACWRNSAQQMACPAAAARRHIADTVVLSLVLRAFAHWQQQLFGSHFHLSPRRAKTCHWNKPLLPGD